MEEKEDFPPESGVGGFVSEFETRLSLFSEGGPPEEFIVAFEDHLAQSRDEPLPAEPAAVDPRPEGAGAVVLDLKETAAKLAVKIGEVMAGKTVLFLRGSEVVARTNAKTFETMDPVWFATWLPANGFVVRFGKSEVDLPEKIGARILRSMEFRALLPVLNGVNAVRLPAFRAALEESGMKARKGFRRLDLLPFGFDAESGVWTESGFDYPEDWTAEDAQEWFRNLFRFFPWTDEDRVAVQFAAMFSAFCRDMFVGRPPMFVWNSNLPGSGKSTLSKLPLRFIFGKASPRTLDQRNRRELAQELNTAAMEHVEAVWFDDVVGKIHAPELRVWITEGNKTGRILGGNRSFDAPVRALTYVTGAQLTIDDHMARRALWVDLFPDAQWTDRKLPKEAIRIDEKWLKDPANRRDFLAALWAMVRHWDHSGRPEGEGSVESLEGWAEIVPGIVAANGFGNCLARFEAPDAGDLDSMESRKLLTALIREFRERGQCNHVDIVATARTHGLFRHVLGELDLIVAELDCRRGWRWETKSPDGIPTDGEKRRQAARWRDERIDSRWGKLWKRLALAGLRFEVDGVKYRFGSRRSNAGALFEIIPLSSEDAVAGVSGLPA